MSKRLNAALTALALSLPLPALATPVSIANYSFETLPTAGLPISCGGACLFSFGDLIPSWSVAPVYGGQWLIASYDSNPAPPDGNVLAFLNAGTISQAVGAAVTGATYTLQVAVMHRNNQVMGATVELLIDGAVVATGTGPDGGAASWNEFSASYTALAADAGKMISIRLGVTSGEGDFDNVRLDAVAPEPQAAPEPASLALIGAGLLGVAGVRRRRR